jgi:predicted outer membrane repeat protein
MGDRTRARLFTPTFTLVTASALAYFMAYAVTIPIIPVYVKTGLHHGKVAVGIASGAFAFCAVFLRPLAGAASDRRGRRIVLVAGAGIVSLSSFLLLTAHSLVPLVALRFLTGGGEALFFVGAVAVVNDLAPESRRAEAMSFFTLSLYIGLSLGPPLGEAMLARAGFDGVWLLSGGLAAVALALGSRLPETRTHAAEHVPARGIRRYMHPAGVGPGLLIFTSVFGFAGFLTFLPLYVRELGLKGTGPIMFAYGVLIVLIRSLGARIPDLVGHERTARIGLAFSAAGLAVAGLIASVPGLLVGTMIFAIGQGLAFPAVMALSADAAPPAERGAALGTTTSFVDMGFALGPIVGGLIASAFNNRATFLGGAIAASLGTIVMILVRGRQRRLTAG